MPGTTRYSATFDRTYEEDDRALPEPALNGRRSRSLSLQANGALYTPLPGGRAPQHRSSSTDNGPGKMPEHIPTRTVAKTTVKSHSNPFQFVKVGTCPLYRKAEEQLKKAKEVKKPDVLKEEEEEWQSNLDSWKSRRRKMSEDVFRRQEEIKQLEMEEQVQQCNQRKTKTFSEMLESRAHRGRALSLCLMNSPLDLQNWEGEGRGSKSCSNSNYSGGSEENSTVNSEDEGVSFKGLNEKNGKGFVQSLSGKSRTDGIANISTTHSPSSSCDGLSELETNGSTVSRRDGQFLDSGLESMSGSHGAADTPDSCSDSSHDGRSSLDCESPTTNGTSSYENGRAKAAMNGNLASHSGTDLKIKLNLSDKDDALGFTFQGAKHDGQVVVTSILEGSLAEASGLRVGDRIKSISGTGTRFRKLSEINAILRKAKEKQCVELDVWRRSKPSNENNHTHQNGMANGYTSTPNIQNGHEEIAQNGNEVIVSSLREPDSPMNSPKLVQEASKNGERSIESENEMYVDDFEELEKSQISVCSTQSSNSRSPINNQENSLQCSATTDLISQSRKPNSNEGSSAVTEKDKTLGKTRDKSPIPEVTIKRVIKKNNKISSKSGSTNLPEVLDQSVKKSVETVPESTVQNDCEQKVRLKVKFKSKAKSGGEEKENSVSVPVIQNGSSEKSDEKLSDKQVVEKSSDSSCNNIPSDSSSRLKDECSPSEIKSGAHPQPTDGQAENSMSKNNKLSIKISDPLLNKIIHTELSQSVSKLNSDKPTNMKMDEPLPKKSTKNIPPDQRKMGSKILIPTIFSKNQEDEKESNKVAVKSKQSSATCIENESDSSANSPEKVPELKDLQLNSSSSEANGLAVDVQVVSAGKKKTKSKSSKKKTSSQKQSPANVAELISADKELLNIIFESHPVTHQNQELGSRANEDPLSEGNPLLSKQEVVPVEKVAEEMEKLILEQLEEEERAKELAAEIQQVKNVEHLLTAPPRLAEPPKEKPPPPPNCANEIQKQPNSLKRVNSTKRIKKEIHKRRSNFLGIENADENTACDESSVPPPLALEEILKAEMELDRESRRKLESATVERLTLEEREIMQKEREIIETLESEERRRLLFGIHSDLPCMLPNDVRPSSCEEDRIYDLQEERKRLEEDHIFTEEKQLLLERAEYIKRQEETPSGAELSAPLLSAASSFPSPSLSSDPNPLESNPSASGGGDENSVLSDSTPSGGKSEGDQAPPIKPPKPIPPPKPLKKKEALRKERERLRQEQEALQREREEHRRKLAEQEELARNQKSHGDADRHLANGPSRPVTSRAKSSQIDTWGQQKVPSARKQNQDSLTEIRYNQNHWLIQEAEMRRIAEQKERRAARAPVATPPRVVPDAFGFVTRHPPAVASDAPLVYSRRDVVPQQAPPAKPSRQEHVLSVSGRKRCSHCSEELGRGAAMIIESLQLYYHIQCFRCCVCQARLGNGSCGTDVRVRNHKLHCQNCYSNDEAGLKFSQV